MNYQGRSTQNVHFSWNTGSQGRRWTINNKAKTATKTVEGMWQSVYSLQKFSGNDHSNHSILFKMSIKNINNELCIGVTNNCDCPSQDFASKKTKNNMFYAVFCNVTQQKLFKIRHLENLQAGRYDQKLWLKNTTYNRNDTVTFELNFYKRNIKISINNRIVRGPSGTLFNNITLHPQAKFRLFAAASHNNNSIQLLSCTVVDHGPGFTANPVPTQSISSTAARVPGSVQTAARQLSAEDELLHQALSRHNSNNNIHSNRQYTYGYGAMSRQSQQLSKPHRQPQPGGPSRPPILMNVVTERSNVNNDGDSGGSGGSGGSSPLYSGSSNYNYPDHNAAAEIAKRGHTYTQRFLHKGFYAHTQPDNVNSNGRKNSGRNKNINYNKNKLQGIENEDEKDGDWDTIDNLQKQKLSVL